MNWLPCKVFTIFCYGEMTEKVFKQFLTLVALDTCMAAPVTFQDLGGCF